MACKGKCGKFCIKEPQRGKRYRGMYNDLPKEKWNKRCTPCEKYFDWDYVKCPCCRFLLRTGSKLTKFKIVARISA